MKSAQELAKFIAHLQKKRKDFLAMKQGDKSNNQVARMYDNYSAALYMDWMSDEQKQKLHHLCSSEKAVKAVNEGSYFSYVQEIMALFYPLIFNERGEFLAEFTEKSFSHLQNPEEKVSLLAVTEQEYVEQMSDPAIANSGNKLLMDKMKQDLAEQYKRDVFFGVVAGTLISGPNAAAGNDPKVLSCTGLFSAFCEFYRGGGASQVKSEGISLADIKKLTQENALLTEQNRDFLAEIKNIQNYLGEKLSQLAADKNVPTDKKIQESAYKELSFSLEELRIAILVGKPINHEISTLSEVLAKKEVHETLELSELNLVQRLVNKAVRAFHALIDKESPLTQIGVFKSHHLDSLHKIANIAKTETEAAKNGESDTSIDGPNMHF